MTERKLYALTDKDAETLIRATETWARTLQMNNRPIKAELRAVSNLIPLDEESVPALLAEVERLRALTKDMARAWGEGYRARGADAIYTGLTGDPSATPNPYEQEQS